METNMYDYDSVASNEYDKRVPWVPEQNQVLCYQRCWCTHATHSAHSVHAARSTAALSFTRAEAATKGWDSGTKAQAYAEGEDIGVVHTFKKWLVVASFVGFGMLSWLAAFHQLATASTTSTSQTTSSSQTESTDSTTSSSSTFLNQSGGSNSGTSSTSGTSSSSSSSAPVSGTHTS